MDLRTLSAGRGIQAKRVRLTVMRRKGEVRNSLFRAEDCGLESVVGGSGSVVEG